MLKYYFTLLIFVCVSILPAEEQKEINISGYMFGDAYWVQANHDSSIAGSDGFWFRRIYLTFEKKIHKNVDVRIRFEMASSGSFSSRSTLIVPFIKDAWLRWQYSKNHSAYFGISEPPSIRVVEKYWGKRYLEKTPEDLQRMESSRDFGIALRGKAVFLKGLNYHFMVGNGSGNKSENNSGKKIMASLFYRFLNAWVLDIYGDYNDNNGVNDYSTWHAFIAYNGNNLDTGLLFSSQEHRNGETFLYRMRVLSGYINYRFLKKWTAILRVDRNMDPNPEGGKISYLPFDETASSTLFIGGIEYRPTESLRFTPNVEIVQYDKNAAGITPSTDIIPRITFFFEF